jgi:hypothetical protein
LRWTTLVQVVVFGLVVGLLVWAAISVVEDWTDWLIFGAIVFATVGLMVAINRRQYPTRKRAFTRDSQSKW